MDLKQELKISKPLGPGHELALSILLTREYVFHIQEREVFEREAISSQQYNILRILRGGPTEGYMIKELRSRVIYRFADVPRLVNRLQAQKLVQRTACPHDKRGSMVRITEKGLALEARVRERLDTVIEPMDRALDAEERTQLLSLLERLRDDYRERLD
jgi:DNA-binding MarR family transcriptional regulator